MNIEHLTNLSFCLVNDIEIDLKINLKKAETIFKDLLDPIFGEIEPPINTFKDRYQELQTKMFIVLDYLFQVRKDIEKTFETASAIYKQMGEQTKETHKLNNPV